MPGTAEEPSVGGGDWRGERDSAAGVQRKAVEHYVAREWAVHLDDVMVRRTSWHYYFRDAAARRDRSPDERIVRVGPRPSGRPKSRVTARSGVARPAKSLDAWLERSNGMIGLPLEWFRPAPPTQRLPPAEVARLYPRYRWRILFEWAFIAYATFYIVRNNFAPVSKEIGAALAYDKDMIGNILAGTAIAYGQAGDGLLRRPERRENTATACR